MNIRIENIVPVKCTIPEFSEANSDTERIGMEIEHIDKKITELNRELTNAKESTKTAKLHEERECYIDELKKRDKLNIADITKVNIYNREKSKGQELLDYLENARKPVSHELDIPASDTEGPKFTDEEKVPHTSLKGIRGMFRRGKIF
jgi:hypothetical protein